MNRFILFLLSFYSLSLFAHHTGSIKGKVTDAKDRTVIVGASVFINGTIFGTVSDINGNYEFRNIEVGSYQFICSYLSCKSDTQNVVIKDDSLSVINFTLQESQINLKEITIEGSRPMSAASSGHIRAIDMQLRPFRTSQDMLQMVPGLVIAQHAGGGKSEQIFLRGFDCDHGTDVSINVDGMPVNMVSHAHGQGYADLHYLISEVVDGIEVNKGPYFAKFGNFATAGAVSFNTKDVLENNMVKMEVGQFNTQKYTFLYQVGHGGAEQNGYIAAQYYHTDGPFKSPQQLQRMNVFAKYFYALTPNSRLTVSLSGFNSGWNASGQIPTRAVTEGIVDRFNGLDNNEGGMTDRENINLTYNFKNHNGDELEIQSYLSSYNFKLFSNFTYFLIDTVNGDMIEQAERRTIQGVNSSYKFATDLGNIRIINRIGVGYRGDNITLQLWHSPDRIRMNAFTSDVITERIFFVYGEQEYFLTPKIRMVLGLRQDFFTFSKDDQLSNALDTLTNGLPHTSGVAYQSIISPKINFIIQPARNFDVYLNFGQGFHSNDARDVVIGQTVNNLSSQWRVNGLTDAQINSSLLKYHFNPEQRNVTAIPKATGGEIGIRTKLFSKLHLSTAFWYLHLQREFVYTGDGGTTELSNPTQRVGFDIESRYSLFSWLWADADVSYAKGKILNEPEGANHIP